MFRAALALRRTAGAALGFTLVELLVWTLVASLAAGLGYGLVAPYAEERKLQAAAERVVAALEYGRELARTENRPVSVKVVPDGRALGANSLRVRYADTSASVAHPLTKTAYRIDFRTDSNLSGVVVRSSQAGGGDTVQFDTHGEPGGEENEFVLQCGGALLRVRVEAHSGRVVVEEADALPIEPR